MVLLFMPAMIIAVQSAPCGIGTSGKIQSFTLELKHRVVRVVPGDTPGEKDVARDSETTFDDTYGPVNLEDDCEWEEYEHTPQELTEKRKYDMIVMKKRKGTLNLNLFKLRNFSCQFCEFFKSGTY